METSRWPPSLKAWVNSVFAQCTPLTRPRVEQELKAVIFHAFHSGALESTDWSKVQLDSCVDHAAASDGRRLRPPPVPTPIVYTAPPQPVASTSKVSKKEKKRKKFAEYGNATQTFVSAEDNAMRMKRAKRFQNDARPATGSGWSTPEQPEPAAVFDPNVIDWDQHTIVGTSKQLEKDYLRLTTVPDPSTIRPLPVLRQTLQLLKRKWREESNYAYICDQFKSMRQDLTVQRIKNEDTVAVYEIHARIALEKGDLGEYNQCQAMLRHLYEFGIPGHPHEFLAYRILYLLCTRDRSELSATMAKLTVRDKADDSVAHALNVRRALATGDYTRFFRLYQKAPKMSGWLMDHFARRERLTALLAIAKSYTQVPLAYVARQLGFESPDQADAFLQAESIALYKSPTGTSVAGRSFDAQGARNLLVPLVAQAAAINVKVRLSKDVRH